MISGNLLVEGRYGASIAAFCRAGIYLSLDYEWYCIIFNVLYN